MEDAAARRTRRLRAGETHSVSEFVEKSLAYAGITIKWKGPAGTVKETGVEEGNEDRVLVKIDPAYFRPTEVDLLLGDATKAKNKLGWESTITFEGLVQDMMEQDMKMMKGIVSDTEHTPGSN